RQRLIQDPAYRLVIPVKAEHRPDEFFAELAKRADVVFVQPDLLASKTSVRVEPADKAKAQSMEVVPTGPGDPLIVENSGKIPGPAEVVLTLNAAKDLGVEEGAEIKLVFFRSASGRREQQSLTLKVVSVLRGEADGERRLYTVLDVVRDIERFRTGITVSARNWIGIAAPPEQSFDSVYVVLETAMTEVELLDERIKGGFAEAKVIEPQAFTAATGLAPGAAEQIILLTNTSKPVSGQQLSNTLQRLSVRKFRVIAGAAKLEARLEGVATPVALRPFDPKRFEMKPIEGDAGKWQDWKPGISYMQAERVLIPKGLAEALKAKVGGRLTLNIQPASAADATKSLAIIVGIDGIVDGDAILIPQALAGMLIRARATPLSFDPALSILVPADVPLRSYRAYGRTIDDVPNIVDYLKDKGDPVHARDQEIKQLQRLDQNLTQMTLIIAAVALIGGAAVLIASFYASVERKKGQLSLLRLLGFSRGSIFSLPVLQSGMLAGLGFLLALGLFLMFSSLINTYYASGLPVRGNICRLTTAHLGIFGLVTLSIAVLASLVAANRTLQIDPAEALRQE
ncbi:MAG TPA: ABC transporter permease, partial [Hyphomicrobiaceae bacterium]|nr:ABC transporter permease [Hyphomicrobiaceae bacterium]